MKIATWNVNSLRVRQEQVEGWLESHTPDLLCLQEIKMVTEDFPVDRFNDLGYESLVSGQKTYNGVAILARGPLSDTLTDIPGLEDPQRRFAAGTWNNTRIVNVYVPNGQEPGSEKFAYKLDWFAHFHEFIRLQLEEYDRLVIVGDFNITPGDEDVHDPEEWAGKIHCTDEERGILAELIALGLADSFRKFDQEPATFSWWDYRAAAFRRNRGLRIDLILSSTRLNDTCSACYVDKEPRRHERPSDHTPVVAEYA